jgi:hypothetical protein
MRNSVLKGAAALAAVVAVGLALPNATKSRVAADPGKFATVQNGTRLIPQTTVPPNCTVPDRQCLWVNAADGNTYMHKIDGTDALLGLLRLSVTLYGGDGGCLVDSSGKSQICLSTANGTVLSYGAGGIGLPALSLFALLALLAPGGAAQLFLCKGRWRPLLFSRNGALAPLFAPQVPPTVKGAAPGAPRILGLCKRLRGALSHVAK